MSSEMTQSEAIELGNKLYANLISNKNNIIYTSDYIEYVRIANKALEKLEKIKEEFKVWKIDTAGYFSSDDETTNLIFALKNILRGDEE